MWSCGRRAGQPRSVLGRRAPLGGLALALSLAASSVLGADAVRVSQADALGAVVERVAPEYSPMAKQLRLQGTVEVEVTIAESGAVEDATTASGNPILAKSAVAAVKKWKFKPFTMEGKPAKAVATLAFAFKL